jgi:hypothetical protein
MFYLIRHSFIQMSSIRTNKAVHNLGNIQRYGEINKYLELFSPVRNVPQLNKPLGTIGNELRAVCHY